jgi:hypothetical protein
MAWAVLICLALLILVAGHLASEWIKGDIDVRRRRVAGATGGNTETLRAIEELRKEVAELRDTTTRFDMSFDAAITHLEQRMDRLEHGTTTTGEAQVLTLNQGR